MLRFPIAFFQKMVSPRLGLAVIVVILAIICTTVTVFAHPLGNFTVNRYSRLEIGATELELLYVIDMAEIPSHRLRTEIDSNGDSVLSAAEQQQFLAVEAERLAQNFTLTINGQSTVLHHQMLNLHFVEGQAGLPTTRIEARFQSDFAATAAATSLDYHDQNFAGQLGWQEVVVQAVDGIALVNSDVPASDLSDELRNYPTDLLTNPPVVNGAKVDFRLGAGGDGKTIGQGDKVTGATGTTGIAKPADGFAELIKTEALTPWAILLAIVAAFGWGAAHAMSPGHGKTIVGAYLVGTRGTVNHAVFLGLTTTITHTAGVFGLGLVTLFLSNFILPETLYPWLGVASGLMIVTLGLSLSWNRLKSALGIAKHAAEHHHHDHDHDHDHHHHHDDTTHHAPRTTHQPLYHDHGDGNFHSHLPPSDEGPVTWRNLLALGVSGGLIPCPSALVLMLGAISLGRIGFGLLLIFVFSLGLASVLSGIGILLVKARSLFERVPVDGRISRLLPVASALLITVVGVGITWQAFLSTFSIG